MLKKRNLLDPKEVLLAGATLEILRELNQRIESLEKRIEAIDNKLEELNNGKLKSLAEEIKKGLAPTFFASKELSIVEAKKIKEIVSIMKEKVSLTSLQLAKMLGLSRTRANEYLRKMEELGIAKGKFVGKEKYYSLVEI
jgi:predicted transcriptional regulator